MASSALQQSPHSISLKTFPSQYFTTLSLERNVERQQRDLARTLRRIHALDSNLTTTYHQHVSPDQPRISLTSCESAEDLNAVMAHINSMPETMPPGMGLAKSIAVNWKRARHWRLARHARKQDEKLQEMRALLNHMKPTEPTEEDQPPDNGVDEAELVRLVKGIKYRANQEYPSPQNDVSNSALLAAQRAFGYQSHTLQAAPATGSPPAVPSLSESATLNADHSLSPCASPAHIPAQSPNTPHMVLARALQELADLPVEPRPVVVEFKADSQNTALVVATLRLVVFLLMRLLVWLCGGLREAAEWCEIVITPPARTSKSLLLHEGHESARDN